MKAELVLDPPQNNASNPQSFQIDEILTIGREAGNDVCFNSDLLSRNHALIRRVEGEYTIMDLASSNGTFVNDKPITVPTALHHNDSIRLGNIVLTFHLHEESRARPKRSGPTKRHFTSVELVALVSDVRNFSELSRTVPANALSTFLATWFQTVDDVIQTNRGNIEKIRGDSILAYWLPASEAHIGGALATARAILQASRKYADQMDREHPGNDFRVGCGIHMGQATLGNIGTDSRRDFTTLGDCINITFRIESLCSELNQSILTTEDIVTRADNGFSFSDLGMHALKGKQNAIHIFAMHDQSS